MNAAAPTIEIIESGELAKRWKVPENDGYAPTPANGRHGNSASHAFASDVTSDSSLGRRSLRVGWRSIDPGTANEPGHGSPLSGSGNG